MQLTTPWGNAETATACARGILFVTTPSHGGYILTDEMNEKIPAAWRAASFNRQAMRGFYEEDCDWCMVALTFPEAFPASALPHARQTFDGFIAPKLARGRPAGLAGRPTITA